MTDEPHQRVMVNTQTYVSFGLLALVAGGVWAIMSGISAMKSDISDARREFKFGFDKIETRMNNLESNKNVWTATDMFKWAVHFQQGNPQIKVPEPEVNTK